MSAELLCASVYMWDEGSHPSDVCWFRAKFEWGRVGKIIIPLGGWVGGSLKKNVRIYIYIYIYIYNVCI